jgi:hypothetical protein
MSHPDTVPYICNGCNTEQETPIYISATCKKCNRCGILHISRAQLARKEINWATFEGSLFGAALVIGCQLLYFAFKKEN